GRRRRRAPLRPVRCGGDRGGRARRAGRTRGLVGARPRAGEALLVGGDGPHARGRLPRAGVNGVRWGHVPVSDTCNKSVTTRPPSEPRFGSARRFRATGVERGPVHRGHVPVSDTSNKTVTGAT